MMGAAEGDLMGTTCIRVGYRITRRQVAGRFCGVADGECWVKAL